MDDERVTIPVQETVSLVSDIFENLGCSGGIAHEVAAHLVDANLCGLESHGLMRTCSTRTSLNQAPVLQQAVTHTVQYDIGIPDHTDDLEIFNDRRTTQTEIFEQA